MRCGHQALKASRRKRAAVASCDVSREGSVRSLSETLWRTVEGGMRKLGGASRGRSRLLILRIQKKGPQSPLIDDLPTNTRYGR